MESIQTRKKLAEVIVKSWMDNSFKTNFINDSKKVLQESGIEIGENIKVTVLEDTEKHKNLVLANKPLDEKVQVNELPEKPNFTELYAYLYTKALKDPKFKEKFIANPVSVIREYGYPLPEDITISVYEDTESERYIIIPVTPKTKVTTEKLEKELVMLESGTTNVNETVNANANINANANVNVNVDVHTNAALEVDLALGIVVVIAAI